jgi:hypothetical protein
LGRNTWIRDALLPLHILSPRFIISEGEQKRCDL